MLGAEQARQRAALVIARVKAGEPPVPEPLAAKHGAGPTVSELAERFLQEYAAVRYKAGTLAWTRTVVCRYIVPEFGKLALAALERTQVRELHHRLSHTPSIANTVVHSIRGDILGCGIVRRAIKMQHRAYQPCGSGDTLSSLFRNRTSSP